MRTGLRIASIFCSIVLITGPATAGNPQKEAKQYRDAGLGYHRSGQYALAADALRQSYAIDGNYETLYDLGQAESGANNFSAAIQAYTLYLQLGGARVPIGLRETVQQEIQRLQFMSSQSAFGAPVSPAPAPAPAPAPFVPAPAPAPAPFVPAPAPAPAPFVPAPAPAPAPAPTPQMNNMQIATDYFNKGQAYEKKGNFEWAKAEYERAYSAYPDFNTLYFIGMMQMKLNQHQQAKETLGKYLSQGQAGVPPYRRSEVEQQLRAIDAVLAQAASQAQAKGRFDQGRMHFANSKFDAAAAEFDASYRLHPLPECLYYLGKCALKQGQYQKAGQAYGRFLNESGGKIPASQKEDVNRDLAQIKTALEQEAKIQSSKTKVEEGLRWYNMGNYVRAIDLYAQAYNIYPNFEIFYYVGQAEAGNNNNAKARVSYERYLLEGGSKVPKNLRTAAEKEVARLKAWEAQEAAKKQSYDLFQKGVALSKNGEFEKALAEFETAYKYYPDFRIQQAIGAAAREMREWDRAIKANQLYIKGGGDQLTPEMRASAEQEIEWLKSTQEAYQLFKKKKMEAALASFVKANSIHPHFEFLFYIAKIEAVLGNSVKALETYKNFISQSGNRAAPLMRNEAEMEIERLNAVVKEEERKEEARVKFDQGLSLMEQGDNEKAIEILEQSYRLDAQNEVNFYLGMALEKLEQYAKARESFERYLSQGKGEINAVRRKEVTVKIEQIKGIETELENKERAEAMLQKGLGLADREMYEDALSVLEESYKLYPNYKALRGIGRSAIGLKRYTLAAGAYERYLREGGTEITGRTAVRIEKLIEKLKIKDEVTKKREESRGYFETALSLRTQGQYKEAIAEFEKAYNTLPSYKLHYSIAKTYGLLKDYDRAIEGYHRFLDEGGNKVKASEREIVKVEIERLNGVKKVMQEKAAEGKVEEEEVFKAQGQTKIEEKPKQEPKQEPKKEPKKELKKEPKKEPKAKKPANKKKATEEDISLIP